MRYFSALPLLLLLVLLGCNTAQQPSASPTAAGTATVQPDAKPSLFAAGLNDYWYEGLAELNTYELEQARYGELREGTVSLVFVSEDFLTDKQVKNDNYSNPNSTPVIKTNLIRRFTTGIYDYSVMSSVFTPTKTDEQPRTLKVTTSMQDWCGQTFTQLNRANGGTWDAQLRSYFEREGDTNENLPADFLEDEVFNRIRANGSDLPLGSFRVLPATGYLLMTHQPYAAAPATTSIAPYGGDTFEAADGDLVEYVVDYGAGKRRLSVVFDAAAPYVIRGWTETYPSRGKELTTTARLTHQVRAPYWQQNKVADDERRATLGLGPL